MPTAVRALQSMMWVQSILGIQGIFFALLLYVLTAGNMPWFIWPLAVLPMLTGPLSLLFRTRRSWVCLLVFMVEGISVLVNGYSLLLLQLMGFLGAIHMALGIAVIIKLSNATMDSWFDR